MSWALISAYQINEQTTMDEALSGDFSKEWISAADAEYESRIDNDMHALGSGSNFLQVEVQLDPNNIGVRDQVQE